MRVEITYKGKKTYYYNVVDVYYGRGIVLVLESGELVNLKTRYVNLMRVR